MPYKDPIKKKTYHEAYYREWYDNLSPEDKKNRKDKNNRGKGRNPKSYLHSLVKPKRHGELSSDFLYELWIKQKGLCAISKVPLTHMLGQGRVSTNASIDRICPNKGYTESNIQLVCCRVNTMKYTDDIPTLAWWCQQILNEVK